jgi:hypothetical protein
MTRYKFQHIGNWLFFEEFTEKAPALQVKIPVSFRLAPTPVVGVV